MKATFCLLLTVALFSACNDSPELPPNNVNDRGHEMPSTTTYTFTQGVLNQTEATGSMGEKRNYLGADFEINKNVSPQVVHFYTNDKNELQREGKVTLKANTWYRVAVRFVNRSGNEINYQYVQDEHARALHQFFFRTFKWDKSNDPNKTIDNLYGKKNFVIYRYGDTFSNGQLIDPPIGFVGYIKIDGEKAEKAEIKKFVLNALLVHVMGKSKLNPLTNSPYPFDEPGKSIIGVSDIDHRFEVDIIQ